MLSHYQFSAGGTNFHVADSGKSDGPTVLLLHGWPENWSAWTDLIELIPPGIRVVAIDMPGMGGSLSDRPPTEKAEIADRIHELVKSMELSSLTLVGHDLGGQVAFSYMVRHPTSLERGVIMNVVVPGVDPWEQVERNPWVWHFRFHSIPALPEALVTDRQRAYFDYFYGAIAKHPERITSEARDRYAQAYSSKEALSVGFGWYRSFVRDVATNHEAISNGLNVVVPLLYLRGDSEGGDMNSYVSGFKRAGFKNVASALVPDAGHFAPEENPRAVWQSIQGFLNS